MDTGPGAEIEPVWTKKYRWIRTWGRETGINGKVHEDYSGYDGNQYIGRIFVDEQTLKKDMWRWAGAYRKSTRTPSMPNSGWLKTAAEAARTVEFYWDAQIERRHADAENKEAEGRIERQVP